MSDGDLKSGANPSRPTLVASVFWTVFRPLWAATAFCIAAGIALIVLYVLGATPSSADLPGVATSQYMAIFLAAGFAGGFVYWLLAGARA